MTVEKRNYSAFLGLDGSALFISISTQPDLHFFILLNILSNAKIPAKIRADKALASILIILQDYNLRTHPDKTTSVKFVGYNLVEGSIRLIVILPLR